MEPRARAAKNVGKTNFAPNELSVLLYGHGDVKTPLPETIRIVDEIATDFIQSLSFEATRTAHHAGRLKVKFEDFEFALRRSPILLGRMQELFEKKKEIDSARKMVDFDDAQLAKDAAREEKGRLGGKRARQLEDEILGEGDDDLQADADVGHVKKKR